jgi:hypothetical protein
MRLRPVDPRTDHEHPLIAEHDGDQESTPVAIETEKNLLLVALAAAEFTVYPINPRGGRALPGTGRPGRWEVRSGRRHRAGARAAD